MKTSLPSADRCGFVAILGVPNAGKSTLVNALVGTKVSIVSRKVQTTRRRIMGIAIKDRAQVVLMDTPGIFDARKRLDRAMVGAAWDAIRDADAVIVMVDVAAPSQTTTRNILGRLDHLKSPLFLVMNKVDRVSRATLLPLAQKFSEEFPKISGIFMVSALKSSGVDDLLQKLAVAMPEGPWAYPEDQLTDLPSRLWAAELTREKVYQFLHEELPYSIHVETEQWENFSNGDIRIMQTIHVERENQKIIVLGKGGQMLRRLGESARQEISEALGVRIHLFLNVRITPGWTDDLAYYDEQGLERPKK